MRRHRPASSLQPRLGAMLAGAVGIATVGLWPGAAQAVDGLRVRTPVVWSDVPCAAVVDRSVDPVLHLPYGIPFEDTEVTADEVADGRRHQFFALCRGHDPTDLLPAWISEADVAAAEAMDLIDLGTVGGGAILDLNRDWQGCAVRITADDQRRPITFEAAAQGVDWDTSGLAAGAWVVEGFTHDPAYSIWSPRPGVVKVVDDPEPAASGPAAAVLNGEEVVRSGEPVAIEGCISAMEGTTLELRWAEIGETEWVTVLVGQPVRGEGFSVDLLLPPEMAGQAARVRIDAEDPQGRRTTAFMGELVIVLPAAPGCDPDGCDTTGGDEGPQETGADESAGPPPAGSSGGGETGAGP
ncbi:MAG: hypothetical protein AB1Z98_29555, partial [Nannocystaceae bacterium]